MKLYSFIFYCFSEANIFIYSICFQAITIVIFPAGVHGLFQGKSLCSGFHFVFLPIHFQYIFLIRHHAYGIPVRHDVSMHIAEPQIPDTLLAPTCLTPFHEPSCGIYIIKPQHVLNKQRNRPQGRPSAKVLSHQRQILTVHPLSGTSCRRRITFPNGVGLESLIGFGHLRQQTARILMCHIMITVSLKCLG